MEVLIYDGSFEGLLTAIFTVYEQRLSTVKIFRAGSGEPSLFGNTVLIDTDNEKAMRVHHRLSKQLSPGSFNSFYRSFLSEIPGIEDHLLNYVRYVLSSIHHVENNFSHPDVLLLHQTARKVEKEKHRMEAFVRFQLTADGLYYSLIQPDHNVLPLISRHFRERYADQRWLIYDTRRKYGLYYDLSSVADVSLEFSVDPTNAAALPAIHDEKEDLYQQLWKQYYQSVNIAARKNMKLHIRQMPRRYWKNLVEKK